MLAGVASFPTFAQQRSDQAARVLKAVDTDNDGTIDLVEVKKAASARFDKLDNDHDGTLTFQEFQGSSTPKPSKQEFDVMDKDHDGQYQKMNIWLRSRDCSRRPIPTTTGVSTLKSFAQRPAESSHLC